MQVMQGSDLGWLLVIVAVAGFLAGRYGKRLRAEQARQAWRESVGKHLKRGGRGLGEEVRQSFPRREQFLSPTQQSSFA